MWEVERDGKTMQIGVKGLMCVGSGERWKDDVDGSKGNGVGGKWREMEG